MLAKKSLGQNFLRDQTIIDRIIDALDLRDDETVIEIGPGHGALTERLIDKAAQVLAIEFDRALIPVLNEKFADRKNLTLVNEDVLTVDLSRMLSRSSKLVANLPYNISTPILQRLIDQRHLFSRLVLMFQREVVERITARPGGKDRGYLSVLVENAFKTEHLFDVPPDAFRPMPKVWSAVVRLIPKRSTVSDEIQFRKILSASFAQKRKNILNNLKPLIAHASSVLQSCNINEKRRAETLTLDEWSRLTAEIKKDRAF